MLRAQIRVKTTLFDENYSQLKDDFGDTPQPELEIHSHPSPKASRKRRFDRITSSSGPPNAMITTSIADFSLNNNNNNVKNERLSPGTPDTSSRSRSVTPSTASHPDTPPASDNPLLAAANGRNYSDFMRSLAAKYNNTNPNDYFAPSRNGFPPGLDPRFKPSFPNLLTPTLPTSKETDSPLKKPDFSSILNPFTNPMFPPMIDMSSTQTLLAMVRTAKEAELQGLLKNVKRSETSSSPLDLSSGNLIPPPCKKLRTKTSNSSSPSGGMMVLPKRAQSESPNGANHTPEDISSWTVDDVCNFVQSIDICAEYANNFREQSIDGSGLPLLTEEHLTTTISMKLGPALKLKSILAKKLGSCHVCTHCTQCHNGSSTQGSTGSPEPTNGTNGNTSDSSAGNS